MGKIIKKCLACGTLNQYEAQECKSCHCALLADVDQDDEILSIDPMEAALDDAVSEAAGEDDLVAQILREQAENAKKIVAKEKAKEERKQKQQNNRNPFSVGGGSSHGFSFSGSSSEKFESKGSSMFEPSPQKSKTGSGSFGGFKIKDSSNEEYTSEGVKLRGVSLRMQAIRQAKNGNKEENE